MTKFKTARGFTLIETLASLSIFGFMVVVITAVFISGLLIQRRASNIQQVQENAGFLLEAMTKEIRLARLLTSDTADCVAAPASSLHFTDQDGRDVVYTRSGDNLTKTINSGLPLVVNSNTIQFTNLGFCVAGQAPADGRQPRVTIFTSIKSTNANQQAAMDIQVTTSQRVLNF